MNERARVFNASDLEKVVKTNLTLPRTALVVEEKDFANYWAIFQRVMMQDPTIRFHHNRLIRDAFLTTSEYFWVDDVNRLYDAGTKLMDALFTYGFYKKFHQNHSTTEQFLEWRRHGRSHQEERKYSPISLQDTNVAVLFKLVHLLMTAGSVLYFTEVIWAQIGIVAKQRTTE